MWFNSSNFKISKIKGLDKELLEGGLGKWRGGGRSIAGMISMLIFIEICQILGTVSISVVNSQV